MCGIAGYIGKKGEVLAKMVETLQHRGPDGRGMEMFSLADQTIALGHTRLSIIDLSEAGAQPMTSADGRYCIVYNGEVYNFRELAARHLHTQTLRSGTDTEVVLELFAKLGINFLEELNGAFAIAIYDKEEGGLRLFRDRAGIKPLYYCETKEGIVFGSEIKALLAYGIEAEVDEYSLQQFFVFKYVPGQRTLLKGIHRLPPGHYLEYHVANKTWRTHRYWSPEEDNSSIRTYREAKEQIRQTMASAIEMRLIADVPVSTFLSGGLDSSIIAAHLRSHPDIHHYCASKTAKDLRKEGSTSDYDHARKLAELWGLNLTEIKIGSDELQLDLIRQTVHFGDDLIADGSQIPSLLIAQEASKSSRVVLTGMGADELFLGYAGHMIALLSLYADKLPGFINRPLTKRFGRMDAGRGKFKAYKRYLQKMGRYYRSPHRFGMYSIVGDYQNGQAITTLEPTASEAVFAKYFAEDADPFKSLKRFELDNFLVKNLNYVDRMSMAHGMESRVPFLDHRMIELAFQLKRSWCLTSRGRPKHILKETFADQVPAHILKRRKAGFGMPLRSLLSQRKRVSALVDIDFFASFNQFSVPHIEQVIERHCTGKEDNASLIYALISYQEWYKSIIRK